MPDQATCWPDQTKPQNPVLFHMELCWGPCYMLEWGYRGFLWTKETPKYISRHKAALVNILREQENKPNFGGSECGNLENSSICFYALAVSICYCLSAIAVFRCFINIQKDANAPTVAILKIFKPCLLPNGVRLSPNLVRGIGVTWRLELLNWPFQYPRWLPWWPALKSWNDICSGTVSQIKLQLGGRHWGVMEIQNC